MPPNNLLCFEDGSLCNFTDAPLDAMVQPYIAIFGVWTYPIIYGIFLGIIWHRSKDPLLVGVIGIMAVALSIANGFISDWSLDFIQVGAGLLAIALAVTLYQVLYKLRAPSS